MFERLFKKSQDSAENKEERIKAAAIRFHGEIFTGPSHADAIFELEKAHPGFDYHDIDSEDTQGFVTTNGRWVNREDARKIVNRTGQMKQTLEPDGLISEDLRQ